MENSGKKGFTVLNPGVLTTVQDFGRIGYQQFGVSVSGAMDPRAMRFANILVGNPEGEAVLECTMLGPQLKFEETTIIAITGGNLGPTLDGQPVKTYCAFRVNAGQTLRFSGLRSTYMKAKIGGFNGRKLEKGDSIGFRDPKAELFNLDKRSMLPEFVPRDVYTLHVIMGPQDDMFTEEGIKTFLSETYTVTPEFDRMGCRLEGPEIAHVNGGDIISDGIAFGAVQVPSAGKPIIMLADRQTTGGYTKIGTIMTADFRILAQLKAGDKVRFEKIGIAAAQEALIAERGALKVFKYAFEH